MKARAGLTRRVLSALGVTALAATGMGIFGTAPAFAADQADFHDIGLSDLKMAVMPVIDGQQTLQPLFEVGQKAQFIFHIKNSYGTTIPNVTLNYLGVSFKTPESTGPSSNHLFFAADLTCSRPEITVPAKPVEMTDGEVITCTSKEITLTEKELGLATWQFSVEAPSIANINSSDLFTGATTSAHGVAIAQADATWGGYTGTPDRGAEPVQLGDQIVFTFTVTNDTSISVTGLGGTSVLGASYTCVPDTLNAKGEKAVCTSSPYTVTQADVNAGKVVEMASFSGTTRAGNHITLAGNSPDIIVAAGGGQNPGVDLLVSKTSSVTKIAPGGQFTYTIVVTNQGTKAATNVAISDKLPSQVEFVSATEGATYDAATGIVVKNIATLGAGAKTSFDIVVKVKSDATAGAKIINKVVTSQDGGCDPNSAAGCGGGTDVPFIDTGLPSTGPTATATTAKTLPTTGSSPLGPIAGAAAAAAILGIAAVVAVRRRHTMQGGTAQ